jgi:hypothetical protein
MVISVKGGMIWRVPPNKPRDSQSLSISVHECKNTVQYQPADQIGVCLVDLHCVSMRSWWDMGHSRSMSQENVDEI